MSWTVTSQGYWEVNIGSVKAGTTTLESTVDSIIDTGTTLIIGDSATVKKIYAAIPGSATATDTVGAGYYTVPCTGNPSTISLTFGGKAFTIAGSTLALDEISSGKCLGGFAADDSFGEFSRPRPCNIFLRNLNTCPLRVLDCRRRLPAERIYRLRLRQLPGRFCHTRLGRLPVQVAYL